MIGAPESALQVQVFAWAKINEARYPELAALYAIPNFGKIQRGRSFDVQIAQRLKEGMRPGVPDIHLPVARGGYIGLWIEMKRQQVRINKTKPPTLTRTKPTAEQLAWHGRLKALGHHVAVCWTAEQAQEVLELYLRRPAPQPLPF